MFCSNRGRNPLILLAPKKKREEIAGAAVRNGTNGRQASRCKAPIMCIVENHQWADDLSEKRHSKVWCHCRAVSKVHTVFPSPLLLFSARKLAWQWGTRSVKVLYIPEMASDLTLMLLTYIICLLTTITLGQSKLACLEKDFLRVLLSGITRPRNWGSRFSVFGSKSCVFLTVCGQIWLTLP